MKNMVIMGPPGSGKDTQIGELKNYIKIQIISSGDISRKLADKDKKLAKIINQGGLVDDNILLAEIDKELTSLDIDEGIIFDGFPRTLHQAEALVELLLHHGRNLDVAIYIELEEEEIINRLSIRRICSTCGRNLQPGLNKCSECDGNAVRRPDDEPAVIIKRVQTFLENTLPLVNYYKNKGILLQIDGNQSIADVARDIKAGLSE
jgi:adenylate kinase